MRKRRRAAVTLVEVLIASGLATMVGAAILTMTLHVARGTEAVSNYAQLNGASRNAIDVMSRKIRVAETVTGYTTNAISFTTQGGGTLAYAWNPGTGELREVENGRARVLLDRCENLEFRVYQRSPMSNEFALFDTTTALYEAKLVQVTWRCSRKVALAPSNTEEIVSAKIMMRIP